MHTVSTILAQPANSRQLHQGYLWVRELPDLGKGQFWKVPEILKTSKKHVWAYKDSSRLFIVHLTSVRGLTIVLDLLKELQTPSHDALPDESNINEQA